MKVKVQNKLTIQLYTTLSISRQSLPTMDKNKKYLLKQNKHANNSKTFRKIFGN